MTYISVPRVKCAHEWTIFSYCNFLNSLLFLSMMVSFDDSSFSNFLFIFSLLETVWKIGSVRGRGSDDRSWIIQFLFYEAFISTKINKMTNMTQWRPVLEHSLAEDLARSKDWLKDLTCKKNLWNAFLSDICEGNVLICLY